MKRLVSIIIILLFLTESVCFAQEASNSDYYVRVGIIDSGVNKINENVLDGYNFLENNTDTADNKGHGSIIAGIILDIAPNSKIVPLKCTELNQITDNAVIIKAIYKAVDDFDCDVLNISIGMPHSEELKSAVDYAVNNGVIIVSAVGNDGELSYKKSKIYYPAGYENVIGAGSVDKNNIVSSFSQKNLSVFITAYGENQDYKGTSFAAAKISGTAAAAKGFNKRISASLYKKYLKEASVDYGDEGYDESYGYGILDIDLFITKLKTIYPINITYLDENEFWLYNSKEDMFKGVLIYLDTGGDFYSESVEIKPKEELKFSINNTVQCFLWQSNIYDLLWIKKGD